MTALAMIRTRRVSHARLASRNSVCSCVGRGSVRSPCRASQASQPSGSSAQEQALVAVLRSPPQRGQAATGDVPDSLEIGSNGGVECLERLIESSCSRMNTYWRAAKLSAARPQDGSTTGISRFRATQPAQAPTGSSPRRRNPGSGRRRTCAPSGYPRQLVLPLAAGGMSSSSTDTPDRSCLERRASRSTKPSILARDDRNTSGFASAAAFAPGSGPPAGPVGAPLGSDTERRHPQAFTEL